MTPNGLQQRHFDYVLGPNQAPELASIAAGATIEKLKLPLDTDAPFVLRSRAVRQAYTVSDPPTQGGLQFLKTRWTGPLGDYRQQAFVSEACSMSYFGQVGNFKPEYPNIQYPAGGEITVDVYNSGASAITNLYLFFCGVKLFPWGSVPAYGYPKKFKSISSSYQIPVANLDVSEFRDNQIFTVNQDADFVIRGGQATVPSSNDGVQASELFLQLMDFNRKSYSNDLIPLDILFGAGGFPAAFPLGPTPDFMTPFGTGPGNPGLIYPEIYLPANHQLQFAVKRADGVAGDSTPVSFTIVLTGQKVFPQ